jgi:hypothetical protein
MAAPIAARTNQETGKRKRGGWAAGRALARYDVESKSAKYALKEVKTGCENPGS